MKSVRPRVGMYRKGWKRLQEERGRVLEVRWREVRVAEMQEGPGPLRYSGFLRQLSGV